MTWSRTQRLIAAAVLVVAAGAVAGTVVAVRHRSEPEPAGVPVRPVVQLTVTPAIIGPGQAATVCGAGFDSHGATVSSRVDDRPGPEAQVDATGKACVRLGAELFPAPRHRYAELSLSGFSATGARVNQSGKVYLATELQPDPLSS